MGYRNKNLMIDINTGNKVTIGSIINEICLIKGFGVTIATRAKDAIHSNLPYFHQDKISGDYIDIKNNTININGTIYKKWFKTFNEINNNNNKIKRNNNRKKN